MATSYPTSLDVFAIRSNGPGNPVDASHVNNLQDAVAAIQATLGTSPQGSAGTVSARIAAAGSALREDVFTGTTGTRSFTLAATPVTYGLEVFKNGLRLQNGVGYGWTAGTTVVTGILFSSAADVVIIRYATATAAPGATTLDAITTGAPNSFSGLVAWWQATDLAYANGATVSAWTDKAASASMGLVTGTPTMATGLTGCAGGKGVYTNAGWFYLPTAPFTGLTAATAFVVAESTGAGDVSAPWWLGGNDAPYWGYGGPFTGTVTEGGFTGTRYQASGTNASFGQNTSTSFRRYMLNHAGSASAWKILMNQQLLASVASAGFAVTSAPRLGNGASNFNGWVAEFGLYNRSLTAQEMTDLDTYLASRHS